MIHYMTCFKVISVFIFTCVEILCTGGIERTTQERTSGVRGKQQCKYFKNVCCDVVVCTRGNRK